MALVSGIEQEASEGIEVAAIVAQEAVDRQADGHHVPGLQLESHYCGGAVLLVLLVPLTGPRHLAPIHHQASAGSKDGVRSARITVDGKGQAVYAGAWSSENACIDVIAPTQIDEDTVVDDRHDLTAGTQAFAFICQRHRECTAAGYSVKERESERERVWGGGIK